MNKKQEKQFIKVQKYASSAISTYAALADSFPDNILFHDAFLKISEQKARDLKLLETTSHLSTPSKGSESTFILRMMKLLGKKRILKMMAESEAEQGDLLRSLSKDYPALKSIAQETYLQRNTLYRLRDQMIHLKKNRKKKKK